MKTFFSSFLALAFLLPAIASADSYCVSFPTSGESKWTKRDNSINVRFRYEYSEYRSNSVQIPRSGFVSTTGGGRGQDSSHNIVWDDNAYQSYSYGDPDICIYNPVPIKLGNKVGRRGNLKRVRLDVKWGGDCGNVTMKNDRFKGNHEFEIYHRKGDLVNPFGCRRKK